MAKLHKSIKGRTINMDEIRNFHGNQRAIGNANLNARGDLLDKNGKIIKFRHDMVQEYYNSNPNAVKHISLKDNISSIPVLQNDELSKVLDSMQAKQNDKKENDSTKKRKLVDKDDENNVNE